MAVWVAMEIIILLLLMLVFLGVPFLQIRKQNQRLREIREFQDRLAVGMRIKTSSGLHARITHIGEQTVELDLGSGLLTTWDKAVVLEAVDQEVVDRQEETDTEAPELS